MKIKKLKGFGINVELYHKDKESLDIYIKTLTELRVEWVRLMFDFLNPIDFKWFEYFIQGCKKNNIKILGLLLNNVHGLIHKSLIPHFFNTTIYDEQKKFNSFIKHVVQRFKKNIVYWQILNEVNTIRFWGKLPNPVEYTRFLMTSSQIIQSIDKDAKILFGSILGHDKNILIPFQPCHFFRDSMKLGAGDYFHIASFHPYFLDCYISFNGTSHYLNMIRKNLEKIKLLKSTYKKPIWITEFGICPRWVKVNAKEIAFIYWNAYLYFKKHNMPLFLWQLTDTRIHIYLRGWTERYFGLLSEELQRKKVYNELVKLINKNNPP